MKKLRVVHVSYSSGIGNGITRFDESIISGISKYSNIDLLAFVVRADFPRGHTSVINGRTHISLIDAFNKLYEVFINADVVQYNGTFDSVISNAALYAGVPAIIEVVHNVETGGLNNFIDSVVCVSDIVKKQQLHKNLVVIENGIDCEKFDIKYGKRHRDKVQIIQVSNSAKELYIELGMITDRVSTNNIDAYLVGDREVVGNIKSLGQIDYMPKIYYNSDILFLLEKKSAFGFVFAEAMACGTIPIISSTSGAVQFIKNDINGLIVNYTNQKSAIDSLNKAIEIVNSDRLIEFQKNARYLIESKYNIKIMIHRYIDLWKTLSAKHRKKPSIPQSWMHLATSAHLFKAGNIEAINFLKLYLADKRSLEPNFLIHPIGKATILYMLSTVCQDLLRNKEIGIVRNFCAKLRESRCISPLLTEVENQL